MDGGLLDIIAKVLYEWRVKHRCLDIAIQETLEEALRKEPAASELPVKQKRTAKKIPEPIIQASSGVYVTKEGVYMTSVGLKKPLRIGYFKRYYGAHLLEEIAKYDFADPRNDECVPETKYFHPLL